MNSKIGWRPGDGHRMRVEKETKSTSGHYMRDHLVTKTVLITHNSSSNCDSNVQGT